MNRQAKLVALKLCEANARIIEQSNGRECMGPATAEQIVGACFADMEDALLAIESTWNRRSDIAGYTLHEECVKIARAALQLAKEGQQ